MFSPKNFLTIFLLSWAATLFAQEAAYFDVYPIRKSHKIGYIKIYGNEAFIIVPPRYDNISDINLPWNGAADREEPSPYRIFEKDEKVGLLDVYLEEVLPNEYKRIRAVMPGYFAAEKDSLFQLVDTGGEIFLDSLFFEDIRLAGAGTPSQPPQFFVKKNGRWGLRPLYGALIFPTQFYEIETAGTPGFFKIKKDPRQKGWHLVDEKGKTLLGQGHQDILMLDENLVAAQNLRWKLYRRHPDGSFKKLGKDDFKSVERLNRHLAVLEQGEKIELWSIPAQTKLREHPVILSVSEDDRGRPKKWYTPLDEGHVIFHPLEKKLKGKNGHLVNREGENISPLYAFIEPLNKPGHFAARGRGGWGMLAPGRSAEPVTGFIFDSIFPFQNDAALTQQLGNFGLLGASAAGVDSVPCLYEMAAILGDTLKLQFKDNVIPFIFGPAGKFEQCPINPNTTHIPPNVRRRKREAPGRERLKLTSWRPLTWRTDNLIFKKNGGTVYLAEQDRMFPDQMVWEKTFPYPDSISKVIFLASERYFAFQLPKKVRAKIIANLPPLALHDHLIFDADARERLTGFPIVGLRDFSPEAKYTAFVALDGSMGLIDREGKTILQDGGLLRFTYIGPFSGGRARVCMGGELVADTKGEREEPDKFNLGDMNAFLRDFNMKSAERLGKKVAPAKVFAVDKPDSPCRWGYVDMNGQLTLELEADYALDFYNWGIPSAQIMRQNDRIAYAVKDANGQTIREKRDADYGIITPEGEEILPTIYSGIDNYQSHYQVAVDSTPTFYFTKKGHQIFVNRTKLRPFSEGLAQFKNDAGQWGFVDTTGREAVPPRFKRARPFSDGRAMVVDSTGHCVFIDKNGEVKIITEKVEKQQRLLGDFHGGRCWFMQNKKWGCLDREGRVAIPPAYFYLPQAKIRKEKKGNPLPMDFAAGVAAVRVVTEDRKKWAAVIDTSGAYIVPPGKYVDIEPFNALGLAAFSKNKNGLKGLLDREGRERASTQFSEIGTFVNGFAKVKNQHGQWGLLSQSGRLVLPMKHHRVGAFSEGLIAVQERAYQGWSFKDTLGRVAIEGLFEQEPPPFFGGVTLVKKRGVEEPFIINKKGQRVEVKGGRPVFFSEGILGVEYRPLREKTGKFYYADAAGNNLFGAYFQEITPFQLGVARVRRVPENKRKTEPFGALNHRGVMIVPPKFRNLHIQPDGNIIINPQRFYGIVDKEGKVLIEPKYDRITMMDGRGLFKVERGEEIGYVRIVEGEQVWVWEMQF